jgi:5-hydroxyisourate hydrolase
MKSPITTHVLDTSRGRPASGVRVTLEKKTKTPEWKKISAGTTDEDGRCNSLVPDDAKLSPGVYRLTFETAPYFRARGTETFYPYIAVSFEIRSSKSHYHIPLLLNPYSYSTYRGS